MVASLLLQKKSHGQGWVLEIGLGQTIGPNVVLWAPGLICQFLRSISGVTVFWVGTQLDAVLGSHFWQFLKVCRQRSLAVGFAGHPTLPFFWITNRKAHHRELLRTFACFSNGLKVGAHVPFRHCGQAAGKAWASCGVLADPLPL